MGRGRFVYIQIGVSEWGVCGWERERQRERERERGCGHEGETLVLSFLRSGKLLSLFCDFSEKIDIKCVCVCVCMFVTTFSAISCYNNNSDKIRTVCFRIF